MFSVRPSLVLSTDNTSLFVLEGNVCGVGEEDEREWKIIDATNNTSLVKRDLE